VTGVPTAALRIAAEWRRFDELSAATLYEMLRLRQQIFVVEQGSPYLDLDGRDRSAWHLLLCCGGAPGGYLRLLPSEGAATALRIGRVAVAAGLRRQGLGRRLMAEALAFCHVRYPGRPIDLAAQLYLAGFYKSFGFAAVSAPYDDFGVAHVEMTKSSG
jgi:ElaA protein